jgi:hypothetical protein
MVRKENCEFPSICHFENRRKYKTKIKMGRGKQ